MIWLDDVESVVGSVLQLKEHFGITVAADEIGASTFEVLGSLAQFIERMLSGYAPVCGRM